MKSRGRPNLADDVNTGSGGYGAASSLLATEVLPCLPRPLGEGWGEGLLARRLKLIFFVFECH
jgi:hypothetical protein